MLSLTGLSSLSKAYIDDLSGGQKQRVALARALAPTPKLILFDEPFSNLDPSLRQPLARDVRDMLKETDSTALFVTHDQSEAFSIADKIGILQDGFFQQWDTPYLIYHEPKNIDIDPAKCSGKRHWLHSAASLTCSNTSSKRVRITSRRASLCTCSPNRSFT